MTTKIAVRRLSQDPGQRCWTWPTVNGLKYELSMHFQEEGQRISWRMGCGTWEMKWQQERSKQCRQLRRWGFWGVVSLSHWFNCARRGHTAVGCIILLSSKVQAGFVNPGAVSNKMEFKGMGLDELIRERLDSRNVHLIKSYICQWVLVTHYCLYSKVPEWQYAFSPSLSSDMQCTKVFI